MASPADTRFAPAGRTPDDMLRRQVAAVSRASLLVSLLDCVQEMVLVLNRQRQIVHANRTFHDFRGTRGGEDILGLRPGEAVGCLHARSANAPDGCGTSEFCRACGAVMAILVSQQDGSAEQEVRILRSVDGDPLNLYVRASQATVEDDEYTLFAVSDISDIRRREELEQLFFHDILNLARGVRGLAQLLGQAPDGQQGDIKQRIHLGIDRLIEETDTQRLITAAERNRLQCTFTWVWSTDLLNETLAAFAESPLLQDRSVVIEPASEELSFESDWSLASRVLAGMVKNALEATEAGDAVTIGCRGEGGHVRFFVRNPAAMPKLVALQIFQRSFSTKGRGRGLGTYSMRLLGERYLKGHISFTSNEQDGTVFTASFPINQARQ